VKVVTIIAGYENVDVLPFTAKAPLEFSERVVFVDGIRPIVKRWNPVVKWDEVKSVPHSQDGTKELCGKIGVDYINPRKPLYNGEKINIAKKYLERLNIDYDVILYLEADEVIEPNDVDIFIRALNTNKKTAWFMSLDLIQLWKNYTGFRISQTKASPSCSKVVYDTLYHFYEGDEGHNATQIIKIAFRNVISGIRMYHLREFRKNSFSRICNSTWYGGGDKGGVDIEKVKFNLERTEFLDDIYNTLEIQDRNIYIKDSKNTYIGLLK
jgi:hypothetical protein